MVIMHLTYASLFFKLAQMSFRNFIYFVFIYLFLFACQSRKPLPEGVSRYEMQEDKIVVYLDGDEPFNPDIVAAGLDYKTRYAKLKSIAKHTSECNVVDYYGISLLAYAAANGDADYMSHLFANGYSLKCNIDPDYEPDYPVGILKHPVELAVRFNHYDALKVLLNNGYKPCCVVDCIEADNLPMLQLLASHGAKIEDGAIPWAYPLICHASSVEMVRYLASVGCSYQKALERTEKMDCDEERKNEIKELIKRAMQN